MDYANTVTGYAAALAAAEGDASRLWIDGQIIRVVPAPAAVNLPARVLDADDFSSVQEALDRAGALPGGACVQLPPAARKIYPVSNSAALRVPEGVYLVGTPSMSELLLITDSDDAPSTSVWWDAVLFTGSRSKWSGIVGVRIRHQGGRRNNTASIAVRAGASRVEVRDCDIDGSIGSAIVVEGNTTTPYPTYCMIRDNKISNTVRHGVYLSGSTHNRVLDNWFFTTRLESIALRNPHDNEVSGNTIVGDGLQYPPHAIAIAQPSVGIYVVKSLSVTRNQVINVPGAGFYGQGVGGNIVSMRHLRQRHQRGSGPRFRLAWDDVFQDQLQPHRGQHHQRREKPGDDVLRMHEEQHQAQQNQQRQSGERGGRRDAVCRVRRPQGRHDDLLRRQRRSEKRHHRRPGPSHCTSTGFSSRPETVRTTSQAM
jgi:parallel beta-helix repeat protein